MTRSDEFAEIKTIADAICDEEVTPKQMVELEKLLLASHEARLFYLEYVGMHAYMQGESSAQMEIVMRRLQVEEIIIRPAGSGGNGEPPNELNNFEKNIEGLPGPVPGKNKTVLYIITFLSMLLISFIAYNLGKGQSQSLAMLESGILTHEKLGELKNENLEAGIYTTKEQATISFTDGDHFSLSKNSQFEIKNQNEIWLIKGKIERTHSSNTDFKIASDSFSIKTKGKLNLHKQKSKISLSTTKQSVILPKRWKPNHYWNFDDKADRAVDLSGKAYGILGQTTTNVEGLIGSGAYKFENRKTDFVDVGSGGGKALGTGSFSVTDGVTIEALIKTEWSGKELDYDEIFRMNQVKNMRMILCFQNDSSSKASKMSVPKVKPGPVISFGLFLVGQGYHELEMPLDGLNGRPTLEELKSQDKTHVVAAYNVASGFKAIYINGTLMASHKYPEGTKMLSGGPGIATIGNIPLFSEPFTGVIDEVAFYDFALTPYIVNQHHQLSSQGKNYFDLEEIESLPESLEITLPQSTKIIIDPQTGLPFIEDK